VSLSACNGRIAWLQKGQALFLRLQGRETHARRTDVESEPTTIQSLADIAARRYADCGLLGYTLSPWLQAGELELDIHRHLLYRQGEIVHLTPTEFERLALLMRNQGVPVTHAKLLRSVWAPEYGTELDYPRSFVKTLRQKIEEDPAKPKYVTEPWVGYRF
jgi:DNA-binding response OmpR family regulator